MHLLNKKLQSNFKAQGWESILKKVKNKSIFEKSPKIKEDVDFNDTLKR